jgi:uncharacterized short protein YbdD (DUF466 family)
MIAQRLQTVWQLVRTLADDDAYERYCRHHALHHRDEPMLDRRAFYIEQQRQKWCGVQRCC